MLTRTSTTIRAIDRRYATCRLSERERDGCCLGAVCTNGGTGAVVLFARNWA